ncbi:MAG: hypothetical protein A3J58_03210 [Candidatus Sungbacteria bacterium RIFCSPHIGHO2_02_FULL_52_23]|uniref:Uncharacterized protein n=1 Tax=Candidatus Sungbacteria bacterium RIFCSPHIGHO2_02_FULL_52_23 TaxID=1802274 RepID=A0A1G2KWD9_9BACT|nr:MAG: hypothetical protein A3J58_03210 [Candidatus Sungbacteria bacterium RIFCSPHIGHO2_02_FULL_52_23]
MDNANKPSTKSLVNTTRISDHFGVTPGQVTRVFSFGIIPTKRQYAIIERWFAAVEAARERLYGMLYAHFQENPPAYLKEKFSYETFFKGRPVLNGLRDIDPTIMTSAVFTALRHKAEGAMAAFHTNHRRLFEEARKKMREYAECLKANEALLRGAADIDWDKIVNALRTRLNTCLAPEYDAVIADFGALCAFRALIAETNALKGAYNHALNQMLPALVKVDEPEEAEESPRLRFFNGRINDLPKFPVAERETPPDTETIIRQLEDMARVIPDTAEILGYIHRIRHKAARRKPGSAVPLPQRVALYCAIRMERNPEEDPSTVAGHFLGEIDRVCEKRRQGLVRTPFDSQIRARYMDIISFRATLAHPDRWTEIQFLRSNAASRRVRAETISAPFEGFSWTSNRTNPAPQYGMALAKDANAPADAPELCICLSPSSAAFSVREKGGDLIYMRPTGGRRGKDNPGKEITWVPGSFDEYPASGVALKLRLYFGRSQARRMLTNKTWGLLSDNPRVFAANAELVGKKRNPQDRWKLFFHMVISGPPPVEYLDFSSDVRSRARTVIGINRGEVNPLAYAVVSVEDGQVLEEGLLGKKEYIDQLIETRRRISEYQSREQTPPRDLRQRVRHLQDTVLGSARAKIHSLIAFWKGILAIERLDDQFHGREQKIIPKKTYLANKTGFMNALSFSGAVRVDKKGNPWGGMIEIYPGGISRTCTQCGTVWLARRPKNPGHRDAMVVIPDIVDDAAATGFDNVDCDAGTVDYGELFTLSREWVRLTPRYSRVMRGTLGDLERAIRQGDDRKSRQMLELALEPQPQWGQFFCHRCGFNGQSDVLAATNLARRAISLIRRLPDTDTPPTP